MGPNSTFLYLGVTVGIFAFRLCRLFHAHKGITADISLALCEYPFLHLVVLSNTYPTGSGLLSNAFFVMAAIMIFTTVEASKYGVFPPQSTARE